MGSSFVFPPRNLPGLAENWGRAVESQVNILDKEITQVSQTVDNGLRATAGQLSVIATQLDTLTQQQLVLQSQQAEIQNTIQRLSNAGVVVENSSGTGSSGTGWYLNPPSVTAASLSGKFEVSIFGTATGAMSYYSFSCPGFVRTRIEGSSLTARTSRISGAGGASTELTVYGSWIVTPTGSPGDAITFTAEALGTTSFSNTVALKIQVRPVL